MANSETMTDTAYRLMAAGSGEVTFLDLWQEVSKEMNIPEEKLKRKKSQFYSELMLDNRFASLKGNVWDLRSRRLFDEVHVDTSDIEIEDDETEETSEEDMALDITDTEESYA